MKRIAFRVEDTQEYQDWLKQQESALEAAGAAIGAQAEPQAMTPPANAPDAPETPARATSRPRSR
jgi:heme/copper-type cytochrome/quinol oxidase subunit 2